MGDSRGHGVRPREVLVTSTRTTHDLPTWQRWHRLRGHEVCGSDPGPRGRGDKDRLRGHEAHGSDPGYRGRGDEDSVARCGMLARPPLRKREREREPLRTGEVGWRVICTHSPGLTPLWALTGRLVPPPQGAPSSQDRPVTPMASHPVDAASLPGDTASEAPAHP